MFGVSLPELLIVFAVVLLFVGPEKLPDAARSIGKLLAQFRRGSDELRRDFYNSVYPPATASKELPSGSASSIGPSAEPVEEGGASNGQSSEPYCCDDPSCECQASTKLLKDDVPQGESLEEVSAASPEPESEDEK